MTDYRLLYFPIKGRAERIRLMFAYAGVNFDDIRWDEENEWLKHKDEMPFGQMPVLEYKGQKLAETKAICRFVGKQLGIMPEDHWEAAQLDMLVDRTEDIFLPLYAYFGESDPIKKKEIVHKAVTESLIPGTKFYDDWLAKSKSGFFGSKLSWADFYLYTSFVGMHEVVSIDLKQFPHITVFMEKICGLPNVKKFNETHPNVPFLLSKNMPPK